MENECVQKSTDFWLHQDMRLNNRNPTFKTAGERCRRISLRQPQATKGVDTSNKAKGNGFDLKALLEVPRHAKGGLVGKRAEESSADHRLTEQVLVVGKVRRKGKCHVISAVVCAKALAVGRVEVNLGALQLIILHKRCQGKKLALRLNLEKRRQIEKDGKILQLFL